MRRRLTALILGLSAALAMAGPAMADTVPEPGNYRDSGTAQYFYAYSSECGMTSCTDTNVYGQIVELRSGEVFTDVCLDRYTYSIRGGKGSFEGGCVQASPDFGDNLSSVSFSGTIPLESCNRRTCTATAGEPLRVARRGRRPDVLQPHREVPVRELHRHLPGPWRAGAGGGHDHGGRNDVGRIREHRLRVLRVQHALPLTRLAPQVSRGSRR